MRSRLLLDIKKAIIEQNICSELAVQATQLVFGKGDERAAIVVIGEAPGAKEDLSGEPFVGASGRLLDELLATIGTTREKIYITNIVKYRPPKNRDPTPKEKADFLPFLLKQIHVIRPKIIVTLGRHSMEYFLPESKISDVHGTLQQVSILGQKYSFLPLYHPAAAIYNRALRETLFADFLLLKEYS